MVIETIVDSHDKNWRKSMTPRWACCLATLSCAHQLGLDVVVPSWLEREHVQSPTYPYDP